MLAVLFAMILSVAPAAPAAGLHLSPQPAPPPSHAGQATPVPINPRAAISGLGGLTPVATGLATAAVGAALAMRRRPEDVIGLPPDVTLVLVPGHGSETEGTFEAIIDGLGVGEDHIERFDWRWGAPEANHVTASQTVSTYDAARLLNAQLAALADDGRRIYLIGHSKGAVAIAAMVAEWDENPAAAVPGVVGGALLDPPLGVGFLNDVQRLGSRLPFLPAIPDNGGYLPKPCALCRDARVALGRAAGVDVMVIRNPDAVVTGFGDEPRGLRIYDLEDDGAESAWRSLLLPWRMVSRIQEAHNSVLEHPAVLGCLHAELRQLGSCHWTAGRSYGTRPRRRPSSGGRLGPNKVR